MSRIILAVDDDRSILRFIGALFSSGGWTVLQAENGPTGYEIFRRESPDIVLLDLHLPGIGGMDLLEILKRDDPEVAVVMLTGNADLETAVEAMRQGAENFLAKPVQALHLQTVVEQTYEKLRLRRQNALLVSRTLPGRKTLAEETGTGEAVARQVELVSRTDSTVLLQGETGVGKTWVAQMIHARSARAQQAFVDINCAGLSPTFLESELFGHEKGAFTDAREQKRGLLEIADRGTIFLDEVGELTPDLQPKLLKVLETRKFRRLGGTREIEVDVRLIAATNRDLEGEVQRNRFREDLFYRLAVFPIRIPALRERPPAEIAWLAYRILEDLQRQLGRKAARLATEALEVLCRHRWPGNIRELRNVIERCLISCAGEDEIQPRHLPAELRDATRQAPLRGAADPLLPLREVERQHILRVLEHCEGNRSRAARILGISRRAIYDKMERLEITSEAAS